MHDATGVLVTLIFWTFVGAVILVPMYLKSRDKQRMYETLRLAYEKGQPVPPELIAALQTNAPAGSMVSTAKRGMRPTIDRTRSGKAAPPGVRSTS